MSASGGDRGGPPRVAHEEPPVSRRRALTRALLGFGAGLGAFLGIPAARFLATPLGDSGGAKEWIALCKSAELAEAGPPIPLRYQRRWRDGYRDAFHSGLVWAARRGGQPFVLSAVCTHLGCSVVWEAGRNALICPCHGGVFSPDGSVAGGPPPRPLARLEAKEEGGSVWIRTGGSG